MILQACLNGARHAGFHPKLPVTPDGLAEDAALAVAAGAHEIHLHVRDGQGRESLSPDDVALTLEAVRRRIPGTLVGISTGAWITQDDDLRFAAIANWRDLPDHASVNLAEGGRPPSSSFSAAGVSAWRRGLPPSRMRSA